MSDQAGSEAERRQAEALAGYGVPEADIARVLGIDPPTLRARYADELATAPVRVNAKVAESLYRNATGEGRQAVTAAIFWLKARARWKETTALEHSGPDEGPIQTLDLTQLSDEQLDALHQLVESQLPPSERQD